MQVNFHFNLYIYLTQVYKNRKYYFNGIILILNIACINNLTTLQNFFYNCKEIYTVNGARHGCRGSHSAGLAVGNQPQSMSRASGGVETLIPDTDIF